MNDSAKAKDMNHDAEADPRMQKTNRLTLNPTGERMVPESSDRFTFWEHVHRYAFASRYVNAKRVLDIACGEGYGAAALQKAGAAHVIGVDIAGDVCLHAHEKYGFDARPGNAEKIPVADSSVDVVVSFETIEHIANPHRFLDECVRVLSPGGRLIISTPNKGIYGVATPNPYHCSEMTEDEFFSALHARFRKIDFYSQHPYSAPWWSPRSLAADVTPWRKLRTFNRLHRSAQFRLAPQVAYDPTDEERTTVVEQILTGTHQRRFLNPYVLRPRHKWDGEKPTYLVANAIGPCPK
ncbi:MAG TPA: class I SAM-dependent methyltransferase [Candidatus Sulfotelmatobacter sp.]|nr:class I SAM-dependent methyltransferase [Candidatus Sulfotelmatobacter sp.]